MLRHYNTYTNRLNALQEKLAETRRLHQENQDVVSRAKKSLTVKQRQEALATQNEQGRLAEEKELIASFHKLWNGDEKSFNERLPQMLSDWYADGVKRQIPDVTANEKIKSNIRNKIETFYS